MIEIPLTEYPFHLFRYLLWQYCGQLSEQQTLLETQRDRMIAECANVSPLFSARVQSCAVPLFSA